MMSLTQVSIGVCWLELAKRSALGNLPMWGITLRKSRLGFQRGGRAAAGGIMLDPTPEDKG
jgi:hypothetical protein